MFGKENLERNIDMLCGSIEPLLDTHFQRHCSIEPLTKPEHSIMLTMFSFIYVLSYIIVYFCMRIQLSWVKYLKLDGILWRWKFFEDRICIQSKLSKVVKITIYKLLYFNNKTSITAILFVKIILFSEIRRNSLNILVLLFYSSIKSYCPT